MTVEEVVGDGEAVAIGITARKAVVKTETTLAVKPGVTTLVRLETTVRACRMC